MNWPIHLECGGGLKCGKILEGDSLSMARMCERDDWCKQCSKGPLDLERGETAVAACLIRR
jgi:hypothetical protein